MSDAPQTGDLALVEHLAGHAQRVKLKLPDGTRWRLAELPPGKGSEIVLIQQRGLAPIAQKTHVLAGNLDTDDRLEVLIDIAYQFVDRIQCSLNDLLSLFDGDGDIVTGYCIRLQYSAISPNPLAGGDESKGYGRYRHGKVKGVHTSFERDCLGRIVGRPISVDQQAAVGCGQAISPAPHPRHLPFDEFEYPIVRSAPVGPLLQMGKDGFFGGQVDRLNRSRHAGEIDKQSGGVVSTPL